MTVVPLPTRQAPAWLDSVEIALQSPDDASAASPAECRRIVERIQRVEAQLTARKLAHIRRMDEAGTAKDHGATSTGSLISGDFGGDRATCSRYVKTAKNLKSATLTEKALRAGDISFEKADVIARTMADLPPELDATTRTEIERRLLSDARIYSLPHLRRRVLRVADIYASKPEVDRDENAKLRRQEALAWQATEFWIGQAKDGVVRGGFTLPVLQAELLRNQVGAIAAPRRRHLDSTSQARADATADLTHAQLLGRAFCAWIERIPTDGLPTTGGTPATLTVNLDYDTLVDQLCEAAGTLATGDRISAAEVRRLACSHGILPRVLSGTSVPLDQGRSKRLFTPAQRLAMADRDGGCTYPGCDRPPAWTEAHHIDWWEAAGGCTDVELGTLLCARHHHWVHAENINIRRRDGRAEFHVGGLWQTNHRWRA